MSNPNTYKVLLDTLPHDQSIHAMDAKIEKRIRITPTSNVFATRASAWVKYINTHILDVPQGQGATA